MNTTRMIAKYDVPKKNLRDNIPIKLKSKTKGETKMGRILEKASKFGEYIVNIICLND